MPHDGRQRQRRVVHESDYDTDVNPPETILEQSNGVTAIPPTSVRTNEELNLIVLQRQDPRVIQILSIAPFAVVYAFSSDTQSWEKTGVEGSLFICQLQSLEVRGQIIEQYSVVILNRKGLENYTANLTSTSNVEITEQFVILQVTDQSSGDNTVNGLWIFSEPEPSSTAKTREINAQIIVECAARAEKSREILEAMVAAESGRFAQQADVNNGGHSTLPVDAPNHYVQHAMNGLANNQEYTAPRHAQSYHDPSYTHAHGPHTTGPLDQQQHTQAQSMQDANLDSQTQYHMAYPAQQMPTRYQPQSQTMSQQYTYQQPLSHPQPQTNTNALLNLFQSARIV